MAAETEIRSESIAAGGPAPIRKVRSPLLPLNHMHRPLSYALLRLWVYTDRGPRVEEQSIGHRAQAKMSK